MSIPSIFFRRKWWWNKDETLLYLNEEHHRIYGNPWAIGLDQYNFLKQQGLCPNHSLLDLGCGVGRSGIHFIRYLNKGHYTGCDSHLPSLEIFKEYEIVLNDLEKKQATILHIDFESDNIEINKKFDFVLAFSVFNHMQKNRPNATQNAVKMLKTGGILITARSKPSDFEDYGLQLVESTEISSNLIPGLVNDFYVFKKRAYK